LLLLAPFIPMLFMGEEFASRTPFLFFTDHNAELAELIRVGRREEFKHFAAFQDPAQRDRIPDPNAAETFGASIPAFEGDDAFHRALLTLRHARITPGIPGCRTAGVTVLNDAALVARWRLGTGKVLAIASNFGHAGAPLKRPSGAPLFGTPKGAWAAAQGGALSALTTIAWIEATT
jgi:maltooligosyltrehalose trehalohydrolase